tara:strand:+ start:805 stop:1074 length:270 start_codon:yes stop_codon:yes gene_type:complete
MYKYKNIEEFIQNELDPLINMYLPFFPLLPKVSLQNTIERAYEFGLQQGGEIKLSIVNGPEETQEAARERLVENLVKNLPLDSEDDGIG